MHGSIVNTNVIIGENCIVNSKALIEHDVNIGSNTHISTGAIINGGSCIGENCFIGSGAIVYHEINITDNTIIPAGAIVRKNITRNNLIRGLEF